MITDHKDMEISLLERAQGKPFMPTNTWQQVYDSIAYVGDYVWGKSRNYLMPLWSTEFTASKINDNIYISNLPSAFNKEALQAEGITHILNLILGIDSIYPDDFIYKNIPARDVARQDLSQYFLECVQFMDEAIKNGGKVLVHCSQGISRSATIVIAYLIKIEGYTFEDALEFTKSKRDMVNPNPGFKKQLKLFEHTS